MTGEIVIVSRSLPHHRPGGMEIVAWDLAREISRLGFSVKVITTSIPGREPESEEDGVTIVALPGTRPGVYSAAWWRESRQYFRLNCMTTTRAVLSVSAGAFGLLRLKRSMPASAFVMQAHGTSWGEVISKFKSRRMRDALGVLRNIAWLARDLFAYGQFDRVVGVGPRVYEDLTSFPICWALPLERVKQIDNGIDTDVFRPCLTMRTRTRLALGISPDAPVVVSASRLHPQKGLGHGLRAFSHLLRLQPDAVYLIAGDGPEEAHLRALAIELGISSQVRFLGFLNRQRLSAVLQAGDSFLFLSDRVEGLPLNVLEALACGLATVVARHLKIYASPFIHLVDQQDSKSVAGALEIALRSSTANRQSLLKEGYSVRAAGKSYLSLIDSIRSADL
jgi:glycosyltransferase involved in cell wall biosynthesis